MLMIPFSLLYIALGDIFIKNPPEHIDKWYGFRTKKSMKNESNWLLAQKLFGEYIKKIAKWGFLLGIIFCVVEVYVLVYLKSTSIFTYCFAAEGILIFVGPIVLIPLINSKLS